MKKLPRCPLTAALLLLCAALHVPPLAAAPAPNYHTRAVKLAAEFIRSAKDPADEAAWKEFVEKRGIAGKQFAAACADAVAVGRAIAADGVPVASEHFTGILADTFAVADAAGGAATAAEPWGELGAAFVVAAITGFAAVRWLLAFIGNHSFVPFAWYRLALGAALLIYLG